MAAMYAGSELKRDFMIKRSHMKRKLTSDNFKSRWFILYTDCLKYYDGTLEKGQGKEKGSVNLDAVHMVEEADLQPYDSNKKFGFQIGYVASSNTTGADSSQAAVRHPLVLYVNATSQTQQNDWVKAVREACVALWSQGQVQAHQRVSLANDPKFHPGIWTANSKQYSCCGQSDRMAPPCRIKTWKLPMSASIVKEKPPVPPPRPAAAVVEQVLRRVVALHDYRSNNPDDLDLFRGDEYDIMDDTVEQFWWKARNKLGRIGFIPSNYVVDVTAAKEGVLEKFPWFYKDLPRNRAEVMLKEDGREGCFLVRDSSTAPGSYTLALYTKELGGVDVGAVRHYHIKKNAQGMYYLSDKHPKSKIEELVEYHKLNAGGLVCRLRHCPEEQSAPSTLGLEHGKFVLDVNDLKFLEEIGKGNFGCVQKAVYKGNTIVAVKKMIEDTLEEENFALEAKNMMMLCHKNLVQLYGFTLKPFYIVTEFMENGCLLNYLKSRRSALLQNTPALVDMCFQVANGMTYLEASKFIHRDLAARNCLVGKSRIIKVADFGLSRFVLDDEYISSSGAKFPIKWASPEVLSFMRFSSKSDIWAFGILMWEVFTGGEMPYRKTSNPDVVELVCKKNYRLEKPLHCPKEVYDVMLKCWEKTAEARPTFEKLSRMLPKLCEDKDYIN